MKQKQMIMSLEHYDYTGYHFYYSPMTCFLSDGKWAEQESRYVDHPEDAFGCEKTERILRTYRQACAG